MHLARTGAGPEALAALIAAAAPRLKVGPDSRILIKPNLVGWDDPFPLAPFGVFTTTRLVEDLIRHFKDAGAGRIAVGEGSVTFRPDDEGTPKLYRRLGYETLAARYGVALVDLNAGPFEARPLAGLRVGVAAPALECDLLVDAPVLKTHNQTLISAGIKNLKGCLRMRARQRLHGKGDHGQGLDELVGALLALLQPGLTVLDGTYALERGPFALGRAHRLDALAASTDCLAVDLLAARLLGLEGDRVPHLVAAARAQGRAPRLEPGQVHGIQPESLARPLATDFDWQTDPACAGPPHWQARGYQGLSLPKYDQSLCTGCSAIYNPLLLLLDSAWARADAGATPRLQALTGKRMVPAPGFEATLLVGDCMIAKNADHPDAAGAVHVAGCPPDLDRIAAALRGLGLDPDGQAPAAFRARLARRYDDDPRFDLRHFAAEGDELSPRLRAR